MRQNQPTNKILYLSTFPPRECGLATFTNDLVRAFQKKFNPTILPKIVAVNQDDLDIYNYKKNVFHQISATNIENYIRIARKINKRDDIKLVHIQHEFGIFGGDWGNYLIPFLQIIEKPVFITFHSVIPRPKRELKQIVQFIVKRAKAVIVMNSLSKKVLEEDYGAKKSKIHLIPHGIPQTSFANKKKEKRKLGLGDKTVLSTFGLLNKGKGIEYILEALPEVIERFPNVLYLILGITHPVVRKYEGESYRVFLENKVEKLGLKDNVKFYNKYLTLKEIVSFLRATDIYLSPSLDRNQSVSGTLSYALGCGCPVISTNSSYAESLVSPQKGILVKPKNKEAIKKALLCLLKKPQTLKQMALASYTETRHMTWPNVALKHFNLYKKFVEVGQKEEKLPPINLKHLKNLTDDFGIIQFAKNTKPDLRYGYSLDDNARALIAAARAWKFSEDKEILKLLRTYLSFIEFCQKKDGSFADIVTKEKTIKENSFSQDSQGRALWALGVMIGEEALPAFLKERAETIFEKAIKQKEISALKPPRAAAFALLGLYHYNKNKRKFYSRRLFQKLTRSLLERFQKTASRDWLWFENQLTYSNSKLPESLLCAFSLTGEKKYLTVAEKSLEFLGSIVFEKDYFSPIGQNGWYFRDGRRAYFDQQPEDASSMVETLTLAYQITKKSAYKQQALKTFQWFLGENHLKQMVYDEVSGGCYDGLGRYSLNLNQGAESTVSYLLARLSIEEIIKKESL